MGNCVQCGEGLPTGAAFCSKCGGCQPQSEPPDTIAAKARSGVSAAVITMIAAAVGVVACLIGFGIGTAVGQQAGITKTLETVNGSAKMFGKSVVQATFTPQDGSWYLVKITAKPQGPWLDSAAWTISNSYPMEDGTFRLSGDSLYGATR